MIIEEVDLAEDEMPDPNLSDYKISDNMITFLEGGNNWQTHKGFLEKIMVGLDAMTQDNDEEIQDPDNPNKTKDTTDIRTTIQPQEVGLPLCNTTARQKDSKGTGRGDGRVVRALLLTLQTAAHILNHP